MSMWKRKLSVKYITPRAEASATHESLLEIQTLKSGLLLLKWNILSIILTDSKAPETTWMRVIEGYVEASRQQFLAIVLSCLFALKNTC